jgi:hypothetical protein
VRSLASSLSTRPPMACGGSTVRLFDCSTGSPFGLHWRCCGASCALPVPALRLHPMVSLALASKLKPGRLAAERRSTTPASREQKTGCHADAGRWALGAGSLADGCWKLRCQPLASDRLWNAQAPPEVPSDLPSCLVEGVHVGHNTSPSLPPMTATPPSQTQFSNSQFCLWPRGPEQAAKAFPARQQSSLCKCSPVPKNSLETAESFHHLPPNGHIAILLRKGYERVCFFDLQTETSRGRVTRP